jgi:hypothetical protein
MPWNCSACLESSLCLTVILPASCKSHGNNERYTGCKPTDAAICGKYSYVDQDHVLVEGPLQAAKRALDTQCWLFSNLLSYAYMTMLDASD